MQTLRDSPRGFSSLVECKGETVRARHAVPLQFRATPSQMGNYEGCFSPLIEVSGVFALNLSYVSETSDEYWAIT
jgi:hypothetical protein